MLLLDVSDGPPAARARGYEPRAFTVPQGVAELRVRFAFAPPPVGPDGNFLTVTLFNPAGFRAPGHRRAPVQDIVPCADAATPGFFTGPIAPRRVAPGARD